MLPGAMRRLPFDRRVEELLVGRDDLAPIVRPMLEAWRQLREQVAAFDKEVRALAKQDPTCRLLMSVPGIGAQAIARRSGIGKARVALARKLSVILHSIWRSGEPFRWSEQAAAA